MTDGLRDRIRRAFAETEDRTIKPVPDGYTEIKFGANNFDGSIDEGFEQRIRSEPVWGRHAARNFNGRVWYECGEFHEQVWRYGNPVGHFSGPTLAGLLERVCDVYGWE